MKIFDGDLAPAGSLIHMESAPFVNLFPGCHSEFVDSGTSALVLAILDAKRNFSDVFHPKVIVSGYCCPDLISACVLAGVMPIVVDCARGDPGYDGDQLYYQLNDDVVAIIFANFLGIASNIDECQRLINSKNLKTKIIEDNAQWFPVTESFTFSSDYCVFSFGRGKPVSLLGGGVLLSKNCLQSDIKAMVLRATSREKYLRLKVNFYNLMINPFFYQMINRNPFITIGRTAYRHHESTCEMDELRISWLQKNIESYRKRWQLDGHLCQLVSRYSVDISLNRIHEIPENRFLGQWLRYPILFESAEQKQHVLKVLEKKGLGGSSFYPSAITKITGVEGKVFPTSILQNASTFSSCIMTLPVHEKVSEKACDEIVKIVNGAY